MDFFETFGSIFVDFSIQHCLGVLILFNFGKVSFLMAIFFLKMAKVRKRGKDC